MARTTYREEPASIGLSRVRGMPFDWSLNPYTGCVHRCTFCYVRGFELRAGRPADARYGTSIRVKTNIVDLVQRQVSRASWRSGTVAIGSATDPYQPAEGRYRLTRGCLEVLAQAAVPFSLITRGPLVVRDLDVLADASRRTPEAGVTFSIPTLDREIWSRTEVATAPPHQRLRALTRLTQAGIRAGVGMAPILPGLTDVPERMADVVRAARDAGAAYVWANVLNLRPGTREHFLEALARDWPALLPTYESLYGSRAYLSDREQEPVQRRVRQLTATYGIGVGGVRPPGATDTRRPGTAVGGDARTARRDRPIGNDAVRQLELADVLGSSWDPRQPVARDPGGHSPGV